MKHLVHNLPHEIFVLSLSPGQFAIEQPFLRHREVPCWLPAPPLQATLPVLLDLLARSAELSHIHIRRGEKKLLNAINTAKVPLKDKHCF